LSVNTSQYVHQCKVQYTSTNIDTLSKFI